MKIWSGLPVFRIQVPHIFAVNFPIFARQDESIKPEKQCSTEKGSIVFSRLLFVKFCSGCRMTIWGSKKIQFVLDFTHGRTQRNQTLHKVVFVQTFSDYSIFRRCGQPRMSKFFVIVVIVLFL